MEAALVAPLLFGLLFAIVDFGIVFSDRHSVRSGVRDAARAAAVSDFDPTPPCTTDAPGATDATKSVICLVEANIARNGAEVHVAVRVEDVDGDGNGATPDTDDYDLRSTLKICVQSPVRSVSRVTAPFIEGPSRLHESNTQIQIERIDVGDSIENAQESGFTGTCDALETSTP